MWPFRKKALEEIKPSKSQAQIDELVAFRKIGEKFNYMGVEIIVTSHKKLIPAGFCFVWEPCLSGDYKNNQGEIKSISFDYSELEALKAENRAASSKYLKDYLSGTLSGDGDS
jgi:hypothetical protein